MFYKTFLSPQVKGSTITSYEQGICDLHHELPNFSRIGIRKVSANSKNFIGWKLTAKKNILWMLVKNLLKSRNYTFPVAHYFTWKLDLVSYIFWIIFSGNNFSLQTRPQTLSNLISLKLLAILRPFTQFQPKIREIKLQKSAKKYLTW